MAERLLQPRERQQLIRILSQLPAVIDLGPRGWRVLLELAGLERFTSLNFSGLAWAVATDLVGSLERFGELPERPTYHSLGALLDTVLNDPSLPNGEAAVLATLIVRYSLVADPEYLDELRNRFGITSEVVRQPAPEVIPPRPAAGTAAPDLVFDPRVGDEEALERIINSEDNFLDIYLLAGATYCAQAVGRIEIPQGQYRGTGFLIGPNLLLTNQHVLKEQTYLEEAVVRFDYLIDGAGVTAPGRVVAMQSDFYYVSPAEALDYAIVRLQEEPLREIAANGELRNKPMAELARLGKHRGYLMLSPLILVEDQRVNILQHPNGQPMKVVMTQNYVCHTTETRVQYVADTMAGSSGSPVFNNRWEVVALHHSGSPYPPEAVADKVKKAWKGRFRVNEGVLMKAILKDFKAKGIDNHLPQH